MQVSSLFLKEQALGKPRQLLLYLLLFMCTELVFLDKSLEILTGPIIAALLCYMYFKLNDKVFVTFYVIVTNDALGCILLGRLSVWYLLILFLCAEFISQAARKTWVVSKKSVLLIILATYISVMPLLADMIEIKSLIMTLFFVYMLIIQYRKNDQDAFVERMMFSISIATGLIALHAVLVGGVDFYDVGDDVEAGVAIRRGILGVGVADPNFSCLLLLTGIACTLCNHSMGYLLKTVLVLLCIGAVTVTLSTAGFLSMIVVMILVITINANLIKWVRYVICLVLGLFLIVSVYSTLPDQQRIPQVDAYIERMEEKYDALIKNNLSETTTGRSELTQDYMNYINSEQSLMHMLFGGNMKRFELFPHNTYIDFLLQFGYIGTFLIVIFWMIRVSNVYKMPHTEYRKISLILKGLYMFYIMSLSVYGGPIFALLFIFMFIL